MKIQNRWSQIVRTHEVDVDHMEIPSSRFDNLVVYRAVILVHTETSRNGRKYKQKPKEIRFEGVTTKNKLNDFLAGRSKTLDRSHSVRRGDWNSQIAAVRREYLEVSQSVGYGRMDSYEKYEGLVPEDPFTRMEAGEDLAFVEIHGASHQLFDIDGVPLPTALYFSYINGKFDNSRYDLLKAAEILMKRDGVELFEDGGHHSAYWGKDLDETDPRYYVGNIPGYNAGKGRSRCLSFVWRPEADDYQRVFEKAKTYRKDREPGSDDLRRAIFDLDLFGLQAGGAVRSDNPERN